MNKQLFVFDLDGTLLDSNKNVSERNRESLLKIQKENNAILFATARPPRAVKSIIADLPVQANTIYYNGAMYRTSDKNDVFFSIKSKVLRKIFKRLSDIAPEAKISIEVNDCWITSENYDYQSFFKIPTGPEMVTEDELLNFDCTKILVIDCEVGSKLQDEFSDVCNVLITDGGSLIQIMDKSASKENAIVHFAKHLKIHQKDITCFGDDFNDIGMFQFCGKSVAMGNAIPELKEIATHITTTNDEDGVAKFIFGDVN